MVSSMPHVVVFPFMAQGHTIPMLDLSKALGRRGLRITLITTPSNSPFIRSNVEQYSDIIKVVEIPFPEVQGLAKGCENMSQISSPEQVVHFLMATKRLQEPFEKALMELYREADQNHDNHPICLISDSFLGWTNKSCSAFGIPRLVFHGMGVLPMAIKKSLSVQDYQNHVREVISLENDQVVDVKGVKLQFPLTKGDLPASLREMRNIVSHFFLEAERCDVESWGVIANSFLELESNHVPSLESLYGDGALAWCVGPLFLYDQIEGGPKTEPPSTSWSMWLDQSRLENSVLYISFGSVAELSGTQLDELAHGLDLSGVHYIWVNKSTTWNPPRKINRQCGLIVNGWLDQRRVLAHKAIGGFLSHCGWNSVLESLSNGVPILAWPMQAEQPLNAKYVVEELKVGLRVPNTTTNATSSEIIVRREVICELVRELMQGERGKRVRERAMQVEKMAKGAVQPGGSSYKKLNELVEQLNLK